MFMRVTARIRLIAVAFIAAFVGAWIGPSQAETEHYRCAKKQFSGDESGWFAIRESRVSLEVDLDTRHWQIDPVIMGGNSFPNTSEELVVLWDHVTDMPMSEDDETFSKVRMTAIWNQRTLEFGVTYLGADGAELAVRRYGCTSLFEPRN